MDLGVACKHIRIREKLCYASVLCVAKWTFSGIFAA